MSVSHLLMEDNCPVCHNLDLNSWSHTLQEGFNNPIGERIHYVRSSELAQSSKDGCIICSLLYRCLQIVDPTVPHYQEGQDPAWHRWNPAEPYWVGLKSKLGSLHLGSPLKIGVYGSSIPTTDEVKKKINRYYCAWEWELYTLPGELSIPGIGPANHTRKSLDLDKGLSFFNHWIKECDISHSCGSQNPSQLPKRCLDLDPEGESMIKLIESEGQRGRYVALSHVWGGMLPIRTTFENIKSHQEGIPLSALPRMFQDAIKVTRALGIRYIWIDSLCIIQDSKGDWEIEAAKMASIYKNCYLNISATRSVNSRQGLFADRWIYRDFFNRIKDETFQWPMESYEVPFDSAFGQTTMFLRPSLDSLHITFMEDAHGWGLAPLLQRAWVFQERMLSPRILHFHTGELVWECQQSTECECSRYSRMVPLREKTDGNLKRQFMQLASTNRVDGFNIQTGRGVLHSKYDLWYRFVEAYTKLDITYDSDILPALAGLANSFKDIGDSGDNYVAGIWEEDLLRGLLWRRIPLDAVVPVVKATQPYADKVPTWSWASGKGDRFGITFQLTNTDDTFTKDPRLEVLGIERTGSYDQDIFLGLETSSIKMRGAFSPAKVCRFQAIGKDHSSIDNDRPAKILLETEEFIICEPDFEYFDPVEGQHRTLDLNSTVYCLALGLRTYGYSKHSKVGDKGMVGQAVGLLLRPSPSKGANCYERIGQVNGMVGMTEGSPDSAHVLKQWGGATEEVIELV